MLCMFLFACVVVDLLFVAFAVVVLIGFRTIGATVLDLQLLDDCVRLLSHI